MEFIVISLVKSHFSCAVDNDFGRSCRSQATRCVQLAIPTPYLVNYDES
jgi:hypothetical protein